MKLLVVLTFASCSLARFVPEASKESEVISAWEKLVAVLAAQGITPEQLGVGRPVHRPAPIAAGRSIDAGLVEGQDKGEAEVDEALKAYLKACSTSSYYPSSTSSYTSYSRPSSGYTSYSRPSSGYTSYSRPSSGSIGGILGNILAGYGSGSNTGYSNTGSNTGYPNTGSNVGYPNTGSNTGYSNTGSNIGYPNTASNIGYYNTGSNIGYPNTGSNIGYSNTGYNVLPYSTTYTGGSTGNNGYTSYTGANTGYYVPNSGYSTGYNNGGSTGLSSGYVRPFTGR